MVTLALSTSFDCSMPWDADACSHLEHEPIKRQFVTRLGDEVRPDRDPRREISQWLQLVSEKYSIKNFPEIWSSVHSPHIFNIHLSSEVPNSSANRRALKSNLLCFCSTSLKDTNSEQVILKIISSQTFIWSPWSSLTWKATFWGFGGIKRMAKA